MSTDNLLSLNCCPIPSPTPSPSTTAQGCILVRLYSVTNTNFILQSTRYRELNFQDRPWSAGLPGLDLSYLDSFIIVCMADLIVTQSGTYSFRSESPGEVEISVGGQLVTGPINLNTGYNKIIIKYTSLNRSDLGIRVFWTPTNGAEHVIPFGSWGCVDLSVSPTPNLTPTITPTPTVTPSIGASPTPTPSVTPTNTVSPSITPSVSITPSISVTPTLTMTRTPTRTPTVTPTPTSSRQPEILSAPTIVSVNPGESCALLRWQAPASPISSLKGYKVQLSSNNGGTWFDADLYIGSWTGEQLDSGRTAVVLTGLNNGTTYKIRIGAVYASPIGTVFCRGLGEATPQIGLTSSAGVNMVNGTVGNETYQYRLLNPAPNLLNIYKIDYYASTTSSTGPFTSLGLVYNNYEATVDETSWRCIELPPGSNNKTVWIRLDTTYSERLADGNYQTVIGQTIAVNPSASVQVTMAPNITFAIPGNEAVEIRWTAPTLNNPVFAPVSYYTIEYSSNSGVTWLEQNLSPLGPGARAGIVNGLTNGVGYIFRVKAVYTEALNSLALSARTTHTGIITPSTI